MGVASYVLCTLLIWVIGFPCFLVARGRYLAMNALPPQGGIAYGYPAASAAALAMQGHPGQGHPGHAGHFLPPQHQYGQPHVPAQQPHAQQAAPTAPPQWSPDRQWWWDGTAWIPAASAPSM